MIYGLYQSSHGAEAQLRRLETVANNMANVGTSGFQRDLLLFREAELYDAEQGGGLRGPEALHAHSGGVVVSETVTARRGGGLQATGSPLDLAITGPGYAQVGNDTGTFLTRDLRLAQRDDGTLVRQGDGLAVLNESGSPLKVLPTVTDIMVGGDGTVSGRDTSGATIPIGRIGLVDVADTRQLVKRGENLFDVPEETIPAGPRTQLKQGFVETSGVEPIDEILTMIATQRAVESNLKMIQFQDDSLSQLLQTIPGR